MDRFWLVGMKIRSIVIVGGALFCLISLSGCLNPTKQIDMGLQAARDEIGIMKSRQPCCEVISDLDYLPLSDARLDVKLPDDNDRTKLFDGIPSYFIPVRVTRDSPVETILIRSSAFSDGLASGVGRVFVPKILFFDEKFDPIGDAVEPGMCFLRRWSEIGFFMAVSVDTSFVTYAIIFSTAYENRDLLGYSDSVTVAAGFVPASYENQIVRAVTAGAELEIWQAEEDERVLGELGGRCHVDFHQREPHESPK